jgi:hypothetical protein
MLHDVQEASHPVRCARRDSATYIRRSRWKARVFRIDPEHVSPRERMVASGLLILAMGCLAFSSLVWWALLN